jgi:hypothetical protein
MEKMMKNKRGFYPLYTTLGLLLAVIVVAIAMQWNMHQGGAYVSHIDHLAYMKMNQHVENIQRMAVSTVKDGVYDSVIGAGRIENGTINPYLEHSKDEGWGMIIEDIQEKASKDFKDVMGGLADYSDGYRNIFYFDDGINVTIHNMADSDIRVEDDEGYLVVVVTLPKVETNEFQGWSSTLHRTNITIPIRVRLHDMYDRAWEFNNAYGDTVTWTVTLALYARAYLAAYTSKDGPFLKEAHYDYDPIATILFGDMETIEKFAGDLGGALDIGAVPAATWLAEWQHLSEPSFLPPSRDLSSSNKEGVQDAIMGNVNMAEIEEGICEDFTGEQRDICESVYDTEKLEGKVEWIEEQKELFGDIQDSIERWSGDYNTAKYEACKSCSQKYDECMEKCDGLSGGARKKCRDSCRSKKAKCRDRGEDVNECREKAISKIRIDKIACDQFREEARELLTPIVEELDATSPEFAEEVIDGVREDQLTDLDVDPKLKDAFEENDEETGLDQTEELFEGAEDAMGDLKDILENRLAEGRIDDGFCESPSVGDCEDDSDCEDEDSCDVHCDGPTCPSSTSEYSCLGDEKTGSVRTEYCTIETYSGKRIRVEDDISQCECRCRASIELLMEINGGLEDIKGIVEHTYRTLEKTHENLEDYLGKREKSEEFQDTVDQLEAEELDYDVSDRIDPEYVKFDMGKSGDWRCYFNPGFDDKDGGVCGDSFESVGLYTVQIAAAALAAFFTGGAAAPLVDYAKDFFPVIIESEVRFNITESIIDDSNRVILTNLGSTEGRLGKPGDAQLYTYAPFEFQIYKDREFSVGAVSGNRVIVYLYLPAIKGGLQRALDALNDESCVESTDPCG